MKDVAAFLELRSEGEDAGIAGALPLLVIKGLIGRAPRRVYAARDGRVRVGIRNRHWYCRPYLSRSLIGQKYGGKHRYYEREKGVAAKAL